MAYAIGGHFGGLLLAFLLTGLIRIVFRALGAKDASIMAIFPPVLFLATATILGGFGFARSSGPEFYLAFQKYLPPAFLIGLLYAYLDHRRRRASRSGAEG